MSVTRAKAWPYAEKLLSRPARSVIVTLRTGKGGVTMLHGRHALTRCYDTGSGRLAADIVAQALGVELPQLGRTVKAAVSTGVLWRAISISSLDPRIPEARPLIERWLQEATEQRQTGAEIEA